MWLKRSCLPSPHWLLGGHRCFPLAKYSDIKIHSQQYVSLLVSELARNARVSAQKKRYLLKVIKVCVWCNQKVSVMSNTCPWMWNLCLIWVSGTVEQQHKSLLWTQFASVKSQIIEYTGNIFFQGYISVHDQVKGRTKINLKASWWEELIFFYYAEWLERWWPHRGGKEKWCHFQVENAAKDIPFDIMLILCPVFVFLWCNALDQRKTHSFPSAFERKRMTNWL